MFCAVVELRKLVIGEREIVRSFWRIVTSEWLIGSRRERPRIRRWIKKERKALSTTLCANGR